MTPGTRVQHRQTGAQGRVQWATGIMAGVRWDNPLTSGPGTCPIAHLEPMPWPDNPTEGT